MRKAVVDFDNTHTEVSIDRLDVMYDPCGVPAVSIVGHMVNCGNMFEPTAKAAVGASGVRKVIFNDPATVIYWDDGTRTVVKCQPGDTFDPKTGFLMAVCKRMCGNTGRFNELLKEFIPGYGVAAPLVEEMRKKLNEYCTGKSCSNCPLDGETCRCGYGQSFLSRFRGDGYDMTDEEIIDAYTIVFKGGKHE